MYLNRRKAQRLALEILSLFMLMLPGLIWPVAAHAAVRLELTSDQVMEAGPGVLLSAGIRVTNEGDATQTYRIGFVAPTGWVCGAYPEEFRLEAGQSEVVFISVDQPPGAAAGDYPIIVNCYPIDMPSISTSVELTVRIPALMRLRVWPNVPTPPDTLSGQDLIQIFNVSNEGNLRAGISVDVETSVDWPVTITPEGLRLDLEPNEAAEVVVSTTIPEVLVGSVNYRVAVTVRSDAVAGMESMEWDTSTFTRIIPRRLTAGSNYATLDGTVQFQVGYQEDEETSTRISIDRMRGDLGRGRTLTLGPVNVRLSGSETSSFQRDRAFRGRYEDEERGYIYGGDFSLNLRAPLLGRYMSGTGGDVAFRSGRSEFRGFYLRGHGSTPTDVGGVQFSQEIGADGVLRLTALRNSERETLENPDAELESATNMGILFGYEPSGHSELTGELGWSNSSGDVSDTAWRVTGRYVNEGFATNAEWLNAGENFIGTWRNTELQRMYLSWSPIDELNLRGFYYNRTHNELVDDPDLQDWNNRTWSAGFTWHAGDLGRLGVTRKIEREWFPFGDESEVEETTTTYSYSRDWNDIHFFASWEDRDREETLTGESETRRELRMDLQALLNPDALLRVGYSNTRRGVGGVAETQERSTFRLGGEFELSDDVELLLNLERDMGATRGTRTSIRGRLAWELSNGSTLAFDLRSYVGESSNPAEFAFTYGHPLSIPLPWFPRKGSLEGRVFYAENPDQGIANVLLSVGNIEMVTDSNGEFVFPALDPGEHQLVVDETTLGIGFIPDVELPYIFLLDAGDTVRIDIPLRQSVVIGGQVLIQVPGEAEGEIIERPLSGMVIELQHEGESSYRVSDTQGRFLYSGLLPGSYTVILRSERLPDWHTILNPVSYSLDLAGGESRTDLVFVVAPIERTIEVTVESEEE
jgi:hypothetical protein